VFANGHPTANFCAAIVKVMTLSTTVIFGKLPTILWESAHHYFVRLHPRQVCQHLIADNFRFGAKGFYVDICKGCPNVGTGRHIHVYISINSEDILHHDIL
jgi:hypothetical protein